MEPIPRTRVVLGFTRRSYPTLLAHAQSVHDGISAAPMLFPSPSPLMVVFAQQIQDLRAAQQATIGKATGTATVRNAKAAIVVTSLENLETYVQSLCDATPGQASVIIEQAAMKIAAQPAHHKAELAAVNGPTSGSALLVANRTIVTAGLTKRNYINWQYSLDGKSWISAPSTLLAKTEIDGLAPLTTVSFRVSATPTKGASTPWSQAVTLLIK
jgi:hypothetical protein